MLHHAIVPPARAPAAGPAYAVVLHGLGDSGDGWRPVAAELRLAGLGYVFVDAPDPYYGGFSWFPIPGISDPLATADDLRRGVRRSRALLGELIEDLLARLSLPPSRLLLLGFSQGCLMAIDQALHGAHVFAGVVGISGFYPVEAALADELAPTAARQDILWTHGDDDPLLPLERTRSEVAALQAQGLPIDWREYRKGHTLDPLRELPEIRAWIAQRIGE